MRANIGLMDILFPMFDLVFDFWPFLLVSSVINARRNLLRTALAIWAFLGLMRLVLVFNPAPIMQSLLIPEPQSTGWFLVVGAGLGLVQLGVIARNVLRAPGGKFGRVATVDDLLALSPREFEEMVADLYRAYGHDAKRTGSLGDHGVDVRVRAANGEKWVVQCKRWRTPVGEPVVRDFYGMMQHEKADKGAIVAVRGFTPQAREWARGKPIILYDGNEFLRAWKRAVKPAGSTKTASAPATDAAQPSPTPALASDPPLCPACGVPMVLRVASTGEHRGKPFYGCPNYPRCREIQPVPDRPDTSAK
ncbi:MAG: restriction endonuclease [Anaerolineae bacterium]|jgi:hypothetical protein|nr:restriction endonuclease [Anaerolineae bacterium]